MVLGTTYFTLAMHRAVDEFINVRQTQSGSLFPYTHTTMYLVA